MRSLILALALTLTGCASEIDGKTAAEVKELTAAEKPAVAATPAAAAGQTMTFSADSSKIEFVGAKVTGDHTGGFKAFNGTATVADGKVNSANVEIDLSTMFTDTEKLTKHLKSADFFEVEKFAKATFETTNIAHAADGKATVTGKLSFHGMTKELTFPATITMADGAGMVKSEFTLKRSDWGLSYPGKPDDLIKEEVLVKLDVKLAPTAG